MLSWPAELSEKGKRQGSYTVCDVFSKLEELRDKCNKAWHFWMNICAFSLSQGDSTRKASSEECEKLNLDFI